jgi:hypothetical protein
MRIHEIAPNKLEQNLHEGRVDPNVVLSLQNIVKAGKITNTFEAIVLARLLEFFKNGNFYQQNNFFDVFVSTSKELLDTLRNLDPKDAQALATKMLELVFIKDKDMLKQYCNPTQEALAWIKLVTSHEAND